MFKAYSIPNHHALMNLLHQLESLKWNSLEGKLRAPSAERLQANPHFVQIDPEKNVIPELRLEIGHLSSPFPSFIIVNMKDKEKDEANRRKFYQTPGCLPGQVEFSSTRDVAADEHLRIAQAYFWRGYTGELWMVRKYSEYAQDKVAIRLALEDMRIQLPESGIPEDELRTIAEICQNAGLHPIA